MLRVVGGRSARAWVVWVWGAYPVRGDPRGWRGAVALLGGVGRGIVVGGGLAAEPMGKMVTAEVEAAEVEAADAREVPAVAVAA